jgi:hypothetical protein
LERALNAEEIADPFGDALQRQHQPEGGAGPGLVKATHATHDRRDRTD